MGAPFVIIGAGHAGLALAQTLRAKGWQDGVTLIERQPGLPVQRPPLSKEALKDGWPEEKNYIRPAAWLEKQNITLKTETEVTALDPAARTVTTNKGETVSWSKLALAAGAAPRRLNCPGSGLGGVHCIRTIGDARALRDDLRGAEYVVIAGGGYIGLEAAACVKTMGKSVTVVEAADRLLARVATPEMSAFFERLHLAKGVSVITGESIERIEGADHVESAVTSGGAVIRAEAVITGIGVTPDLTLLPFLGEDGESGADVDENCMTKTPGVYAIGDIAKIDWPFARMRIESIHNAQHTAALAAHHALGLEPPKYQPPWFWSDQYGGKLQSVGVPLKWDRVVWRDGAGPDSGAAFAFQNGTLISVEAFNLAPAFMLGKKILSGAGAATMADIEDLANDLRTLAAKTA
ncbi:MAG: NAD(P)/FAD-dependent oxidoreductase [Rhodospirillales bacterium]